MFPRHVARSQLSLPILVLCAVLALGCGIPHDPVGTLEELESRPLRVGVAEAGPWVMIDEPPPGEEGATSRAVGEVVPGHRVRGVEPDLVRDLADSLGTPVEWHAGGEGELLEALKRYELDLVVGGLTRSSPWSKHVGMTAPYVKSGAGARVAAHVWAAPPGENGFLMRLEHFLAAHKDEAVAAAEAKGLAVAREARE